jgi:hypothetical protein
VISAPFAWVGTAGQIASQLRDYGRRWGISRYVIRADALDNAKHTFSTLSSDTAPDADSPISPRLRRISDDPFSGTLAAGGWSP